jgi:large subunit ribosomal protein L21
MFAIIRSGNRQFRVQEGNLIKVEKRLEEEGQEFAFDEVLAFGYENKTFMVGTPFVKGATVKAEIVSNYRDDKVLVFKKKRRKNYRRLNGHRQDVTMVLIKQLTLAKS